MWFYAADVTSMGLKQNRTSCFSSLHRKGQGWVAVSLLTEKASEVLRAEKTADEAGMVTSVSHQGRDAPSHEGNEGLLREASFGLKVSSEERVETGSSPTVILLHSKFISQNKFDPVIVMSAPLTLA